MKILLPGDSVLKQIISKPPIGGNKYRLLKYCITEDVEQGILLYNTLTKSLKLLSKSEWDSLEGQTYLLESWDLVPEEFEDKKFLEQIVNLYALFNRKKSYIDNYTIFTTTSCNARCPYCFENGVAGENMNIETAEQLLEFILKKSSKRSISIRWFGGEPLVNTEIIEYLSKRLHDENIDFVSSMVSNGYLLNDEMILRAVNQWKLREIQITLDGTEEKYHAIKRYKNNDPNAYQKVLNNIDILLKQGVYVRIRLNLSEDNGEDLLHLIDSLNERFIDKKYLYIFCNTLFEKNGDKVKRRSDEKEKQLRLMQIRIMNKIHEYGLYKMNLKRRFQMSVCNANRGDSVTVLPNGMLGVCEHRLQDDYVGNLKNGELDAEVIKLYKMKTEDRKECLKCRAYLECNRQKKCDAVTEWCSEEKKSALIRDLQLRMLYEYQKFLDKGENER